MRPRARPSSGVTLVEFVASVVFGLPLLVFTIYCVLEANYYFSIMTQMEVAARRAAAKAVAWYTLNAPASANDASMLNSDTTLNIPGFVDVSNSPFTASWSVPATGGVAPYTVTVYCKYPPGGDTAHGIFPFPSPDPLGMGPSINAGAPIGALATFNLVPEK